MFDAVMRHLERGVYVEPVSVGIFLKNPRKFAELRPLQRWTALSFYLRRPAGHRTIVRKVVRYGEIPPRRQRRRAGGLRR